MNPLDSKKLEEIEKLWNEWNVIGLPNGNWLIAKVKEQDREIERLTRSGDESWQKLRDDVCDARHEEQAQWKKAEEAEADLARCTENFDLEQRKIMEWRTKAEKAENLLAGKGKPCTCGTGYDPECPSEHGAEKEKP